MMYSMDPGPAMVQKELPKIAVRRLRQARACCRSRPGIFLAGHVAEPGDEFGGLPLVEDRLGAEFQAVLAHAGGGIAAEHDDAAAVRIGLAAADDVHARALLEDQVDDGHVPATR